MGNVVSVMPGFIIVVVVGLILAVIGFNMAFRQTAVRDLIDRPAPPRSPDEDEDPLAYALRISGVMIMAFGIVIDGMVVTFHLAS
ncbi:MAG: hypothetical protein JWQ16_2513 [Novosphingobium sp.]|nr:hypothetical protein [Novosphingobium sp.]